MRLLLAFALSVNVAYAAPLFVPDDSEAPGAINPVVTQATIHETICVPGWSSKARPSVSFTAPIKRRLIDRFYHGASADEFELDHRVPIEDGGCPDCVSNLVLQRWRDPRHHACHPQEDMDAACKDQLENFVHAAICHGRMTLIEGQSLFLGDWTVAYRQYLNGRRRHLQ